MGKSNLKKSVHLYVADKKNFIVSKKDRYLNI